MTPERIAEMRSRLTKSTPLYGISVDECFDLLAAVESLQADNARLRAALVEARAGLFAVEIIQPELIAAIDAALEESR